MKYLAQLYFLLSTLFYLIEDGQSQTTALPIELDAIDQIRIIDHQNLNFEWYCGRVYEIQKNEGTYEMYLVEQYNKPIFFGMLNSNLEEDSLNIKDSKLLGKLDVSLEIDSAMTLANQVLSRKHSYWEKRINIPNSDQPIRIDSFQVEWLMNFVKAVNDQSASNPWKMRDQLGLDSLWLRENAEGLFEKYKLSGIEPSPAQKEYCLSCFLDEKKTAQAAMGFIGFANTYDYPVIEVQFIKSQDTLYLYTRIPNPLSLPWTFMDTLELYNPQISIKLSELLPNLAFSNKKRLSLDSQSLERVFTKALIKRFCTKFNGKRGKRRKRIYIDSDK